MKNRYVTHAQKRRQLKHTLKLIYRAIKKGVWNELSLLQRNRLMQKAQRLLRVLRSSLSRAELAKLSTGALFSTMMAISAHAQLNFDVPVTNPFGFPGVQNTSALEDVGDVFFVDIDGDLDMDLFLGLDTNFNASTEPLYYFENTGSQTNPQFGSFGEFPFGMQAGTMTDYPHPAFVDIDNDSDQDLFLGVGITPLRFYVNSGSDLAPNFSTTPQSGVFGLPTANTGPYYNPDPHFVDIDNDADMDLFIMYKYGDMVFYRNSGSAGSPSFEAGVPDPFGIPNFPFLNNYHASFMDADCDGDQDLFVSQGSTVRYHENVGAPDDPQFLSNSVNNPFGIASPGAHSIAFCDIDGDKDLDMFRVETSYGSAPSLIMFESSCGGNNGVNETTPGTLTADASTNCYQWLDCTNGSAEILNETSQSYTPAQSGEYAVVIGFGGGCQDTSDCYCIISDLTVSQAGKTLTANENGLEYQWVDNCDGTPIPIVGATSQSYTVESTGYYSVILSVPGSNCADISECFHVDLAGIETLENGGYKVYPNPTNGELTLMNEMQLASRIRVQDFTGRVVFEQESSSSLKLDLSHEAKGIYILTVSNEQGVYTERITVE